MKLLLKRIVLALVIFIVSTVLMLFVLSIFPKMNDMLVYFILGIYLVVSQLGFIIDIK